jgi:hypothetical protein
MAGTNELRSGPREGWFRVDEVFALERRPFVVVAGELVEGVAEPGMFLWIPLNLSLNMTVRITGVERLLRRPGIEQLALTVAYDDEAMPDLLIGLNFAGETLRLSEEGED